MVAPTERPGPPADASGARRAMRAFEALSKEPAGFLLLVRAWRELRKMRTAIILLCLLAILAIVGTLLPQLPQNPEGVMGYVLRHPVTGPIFARLGLFDVFSSWPFIITAVLMYTSIGASMFIRVPAAWRRARVPAYRSRALGAEIASIVFHASFFILLVGVLFGKAAGFVGNAAVIQGHTFTESVANYDNLSEGLLSGPHTGFQVKVDSFNAQYWPSGAPKDFTSHVQIIDKGRVVESQSIKVNHYLDYDGIKIYQAGYGWAPDLRITTPDGRVVSDGPTVFVGDPQFAQGVVKAPSAGPPGQQLGLSALFLPDPQVSGTAISPGTPALRNPLLLVAIYRGDLHLDSGAPQNVFSLDTTGMDLRWRGGLRPGDSVTTPDGYQISFKGIDQYTDLTLNKDPGVPIVLAAFFIGLTALLISLYLPVLGKEDKLSPAKELVEG